jgi:adenine-specific DNA-methyltransferase
MLGKIFEKMISISSENIDSILEEYNKNESSGKKKKLEIDNILNKKLGAFYTPREIVHYMTKESLIAYLVNNLKGKKEENEEKIRQLFDFKEQFLLNEQILHKEQKEIFIKLSNSIYEVDEILKKVKVLDPAI